ncbi:rhodanese-like domain-containing protein [Paenibacillus naphthalenovorans]|uniref:Rhodanese-like domain-containing protein n=1 Tax=Paenibacillus naphthalenovorans TaxID=162209 RepID=A0A0U2UP03_9BACL|nr:rhodanese-like domain-containing protein [Paenibacillus naphthalenovorans]ALS23729.1 rhodanese-like domain-containing protein [Paenibacillus naphthalenovorans]
MFILLVLLAIGLIWFIRSVWPVSGLSFVDSRILEAAREEMTTLKIVDVRDAADYQKNHYPGSINISLGRLPFVWRNELSPDEPVLILADSRRKSIKAARVLKNKGFSHLYALRRVSGY